MSGLREIGAIGAAVALSCGLGFGMKEPSYNPATKRDPNKSYTYTEKPLSKRAKRRLRGKPRP